MKGYTMTLDTVVTIFSILGAVIAALCTIQWLDTLRVNKEYENSTEAISAQMTLINLSITQYQAANRFGK